MTINVILDGEYHTSPDRLFGPNNVKLDFVPWTSSVFHFMQFWTAKLDFRDSIWERIKVSYVGIHSRLLISILGYNPSELMSSFSSLLCPIKKSNKSVRISTKYTHFVHFSRSTYFRVKKPTTTSGRTGFDISLLSFSKESKSP